MDGCCDDERGCCRAIADGHTSGWRTLGRLPCERPGSRRGEGNPSSRGRGANRRSSDSRAAEATRVVGSALGGRVNGGAMMGLPGPSIPIIVEPLELPKPARTPAPAAPERQPIEREPVTPVEEPVPA